MREIVIAKRITQQIQRSRVLELYLNCIEFGPNIFGIQAASRHYFQKDARTLTPLEAVFLAMLKPAPSWGGWIVRRGETPSMPYWSFRTEQILQRLVKAQYLTQEDADAQRPYTLYWTDGQYQDRNKPPIVPATLELNRQLPVGCRPYEDTFNVHDSAVRRVCGGLRSDVR